MIDSNNFTKIGKRRKIPVIYETEAEIIRSIYELIAFKKYGTDKIAIYLNNKGIKRRKENCLWDSNEILDIVKNPIYKGYVSFGKVNRTREHYIKKNRDTWIIADKQNPDIAIVSEELWQKANDIILSRSRKGDRVLRLLSGYTRCGYCGNYIVPKGKMKYCYMLCKGKQKVGFCEYNRNYRVDILETIVSNEIKRYLDTYKKIDLKNEIVKRVKRIKRREDKLRLLNQKISCSKNRLIEVKTNIVAALMSGNKEESEKISKEFNNEMNNLKLLEEQLENIKSEIDINNQEINGIKDCIPTWSDEFENSPLDIKRQILDKLINKVYLYNEKVEIEVKYPITTIIMKESI